MNFWDQQFAVEGFKYGKAANTFVCQQARHLPAAARILVPGDGEGRNSVWLAAQGHSVLAMDASIVGLQKAHAYTAERGVVIETVLADLTNWQPEAGSFDAVVLTYVHLPPAVLTVAHQRLALALRPGGVLMLEAFHPAQLGRSSGGPRQPDLLYSRADLRADFAGLLTEELAEECEVILDEGPGHQGSACVTRYLARRV